jgi:tetratricopeptide (TPR) repeat protein
MKTLSTRIGQAACLAFLVLQLNAFAQNAEYDSGVRSANAGDFRTALIHFKDSLDKVSTARAQAQVYYNIGVCFYHLKQADKAIAELKKAVLIDPRYEKAYYALGMAYSDSQNWTAAETALERAIKLANGRNGEAWFDLAFVYLAQKNFDEALKGFQNAIKYRSVASAASHNNIGVIYAMNGNMLKATEEIEKAISLGYDDARNNLQRLSKTTAQGDRSVFSTLIVR